MRVLGKPVAQLRASDLDALVAAAAAEDASLELKLRLPLPIDPVDGESQAARQEREDEARTEFLRDVSAFANMRSGTILYGVAERAGGIASKVTGLGQLRDGQEKLRLEQLLESGLQPPLRGHEIHIVEHDNGDVLVLGIPRSFIGPHMVMGPRHVGQFWGRNSAGKYLMDITQVRRAMLEVAAWETELESFRESRLEAARIVPGLQYAQGVLFLHVLPLGRLRERVNLIGTKPPVGTHFETTLDGTRANVDGVRITYATGTRARSYVQCFRNGGVEVAWAVPALMYPGNEQGRATVLNGLHVNRELTLLIGKATTWFEALNVEPPYAIFVSAVNVRGFTLGRGPAEGELYLTAFDRPTILVPSVTVESREANLDTVTGDVLNLLWEAAGWPQNALVGIR
jgi:hypothetical protein